MLYKGGKTVSKILISYIISCEFSSPYGRMRRESLEECREMSVTQVMASVIGGRVPLDYGPWLRFSADGLDLVRALLARPPQVTYLSSKWFLGLGCTSGTPMHISFFMLFSAYKVQL